MLKGFQRLEGNDAIILPQTLATYKSRGMANLRKTPNGNLVVLAYGSDFRRSGVLRNLSLEKAS